jgi:hypothetical protein
MIARHWTWEPTMAATDLSTYPVHLGRGGKAVTEPAFTGDMAWYMNYGQRHAADGADARLFSQFTFTESWPTWEMHPNGDEVVLCTAGVMVLHQEHPDGTRSQVTLEPGQYAINAPGVWHTADIPESATGVFITAGMGTQVRPR